MAAKKDHPIGSPAFARYQEKKQAEQAAADARKAAHDALKGGKK